MNTEELIIAALALGLFIRWGNKSQLKGRKRPEDSGTFGVLLLIVFGVAMYVWLTSTHQIH